MIERSEGFKWMAGWLGYQFGRIRLKSPRMATPLMILVLMVATWVTAGLMHNVTSILIMTPIIIRLCDSYGVPSRWILSGALIASNLGGFSTRWGDTPNIIEAEVWGLKALDFTKEIVPPNLIVLAILSCVVTFLTQRTLSRTGVLAGVGAPLTIDIAKGAAGWKEAQANLNVDKRLLFVGLATMSAFIVLHVVFDEIKIAIGAATIFVAILLERKHDRFHSLTSLGYEVYMTFAAIFVLAGCVKFSYIGATLQQQIEATGAAPWAIALTGYFGTMFTEAASWASAASHQIHDLGGAAHHHAAAWALGGGICAGSSSLITAASAGIILFQESTRFRDEKHVVTFKKYLPFGIGFSLFMLAFYATYFTIFAGGEG
jgi:Na+/H+ antiporter NhaD/arsenite permease-like protein